jgi:spermidine synthase
MSNSAKSDNSIWLHDKVSPDLVQIHSIKKVLYSGRTDFQSVDIVDSAGFGMCLVLDGKIQCSECDEFIYHEALVHPAMLSHPDPETVFIAGGGEGATLREALRYKSVKKAVMVDIDKQVVDICRQYLPAIHQHAFDDPRAEIYYTDARKYLEETKEKFDVIIIDLVEPLEVGPACLLYTQEYYQIIRDRLNDGGIMSVQSGASGWVNLQNFIDIMNTLKSVFSTVCPYQVYVPSFVDLWGYATASQSLNPATLSPAEVDRRISRRLSKELKSYDGLSHQVLFALSKHLRQMLAKPGRIITDANPLYM